MEEGEKVFRKHKMQKWNQKSKKNSPDNGLVEMVVYRYSGDKIQIRISNGTNENVTLENAVKLQYLKR